MNRFVIKKNHLLRVNAPLLDMSFSTFKTFFILHILHVFKEVYAHKKENGVGLWGFFVCLFVCFVVCGFFWCGFLCGFFFVSSKMSSFLFGESHN